MINSIKIGNQEINFRLRQAGLVRNLRLSVHPSKGLSVSAPRWVSKKTIINFLLDKQEWILKNLEIQKQKQVSAGTSGTHKDFLLNKSKALHLVRDKIAKLNAVYGFKHGKVSIKNMTSRWGSCSKKGNLNFNYKMVYLADELAEYIVAHELSHLSQMNHGRNFWKLVASTIPNWQILRKQLKSIN